MHPISLVNDVDSDDTLTWMVRNISNQNIIEDFTEEIDEARFVRQYNCSNLLVKKLYLSLALINLLLGVVHHSSSLVTMAIPMPHWDVTSDYLSVDHNSRSPSST